MLFVTELYFYAEKMEEAIKLRSQWQNPPGVKPVAEYLLLGQRRVISIDEATDAAALMQAVAPWAALADITVSPATTTEEALKLLAQMGKEKAA